MNSRFAAIALMVVLVAPVALAASAAQVLDAPGIRARLAAAGLELPKSMAVKRSATLPGYYEVQLGDQTLHISESGDYMFVGDLFLIEPGELVNATELARQQERQELLASLSERDMVVFSPPKGRVKATLTIFTDIDCGYCRKLHQEMAELNGYGIAVRYLAFPRAGIGSESYNKIVSAWCADDPQQALTSAKAGRQIEARACENPVAQQYELGGRLGIGGTPAILYENGYLQAGYAPAAEMARRLGLVN